MAVLIGTRRFEDKRWHDVRKEHEMEVRGELEEETEKSIYKKVHCTHVYISEKINLSNMDLKHKYISFSLEPIILTCF